MNFLIESDPRLWVSSRGYRANYRDLIRDLRFIDTATVHGRALPVRDGPIEHS